MEKYKFFFEYFMEPVCYKDRIGLMFSLYNAVKNFLIILHILNLSKLFSKIISENLKS